MLDLKSNNYIDLGLVWHKFYLLHKSLQWLPFDQTVQTLTCVNPSGSQILKIRYQYFPSQMVSYPDIIILSDDMKMKIRCNKRMHNIINLKIFVTFRCTFL